MPSPSLPKDSSGGFLLSGNTEATHAYSLANLLLSSNATPLL